MLNATSYKKAMIWLYSELETEATDRSDFYITGNNNAPIFFNEAQLDKIIDTTQNKDLKPLNNKLWSHIKVKKERSQEDYQLKTEYDRYLIEKDEFTRMMSFMNIDSYDEFWKFSYSLLRAEVNDQITHDQALDAMKIISQVAPNDETQLQWEQDNINKYQSFKSGVEDGTIDLKRSLPLVRYDEYIQAMMND